MSNEEKVDAADAADVDDADDGEDGDDDDDDNVEPAVFKWQAWILLRLKLLLPTVRESVLTEYVRDYPPDLEAFVQHNALYIKALFIAPDRREIRAITPPMSTAVNPVIEQTEAIKSPPPRKPKSWQRKSSKKKKKKPDQKAVKKKTKESPKRVPRPNAVFVPKPETIINAELAAELEQEIRAAGDDQHETEAVKINVQLNLSVNNWPDTDEYVYVVRQQDFALNVQIDASSADKNEFDQRFYVGYTQAGDICRLADRIIRSILKKADDDYPQQIVDILALVTTNLKQSTRKSDDILYDLVVRTVGGTLSTKTIKRPMGRDAQRYSEQSDSHATTHADSINQLLAAEISRYCNRLHQQQGRFVGDDDADRLCMLKCQLALYDIDFLLDSTLTVRHVSDRLTWATRQLDFIASMSSSDAALQRWLANTIAYLCEFVGRIVASRLARKAELLTAGGPMPIVEEGEEKEEARMATRMARDMVSAASHLQAALSSAISAQAGTSEIDRLDAATRLLIPLEEEMERVLELMGRLDDDRRDMARERTAINRAWHSVQAIGRSIEALSLEGAIEAGNTEALRDLCRQVGDAADKLQQQIDELQ